MKTSFFNIYYSLGINKRAIIFLVIGVVIIIAAKQYTHTNYMRQAERDLAQYRVAYRDLSRYFVKGAPTFDELITRSKNYDKQYIKEATKIVDMISFSEPGNDIYIKPDERFPHIKFKQLIDTCNAIISEKLPGVTVNGKFLKKQTLVTSLELLNKHLKTAWILETFVERMVANGYNNEHIKNISIEPSALNALLQDINLFENSNLYVINVQFNVTIDLLTHIYNVLRSEKGYFFVEDVYITSSDDTGSNTDETKVNARFRLLHLDLSVKKLINYSPVTPQWKIEKDMD